MLVERWRQIWLEFHGAFTCDGVIAALRIALGCRLVEAPWRRQAQPERTGGFGDGGRGGAACVRAGAGAKAPQPAYSPCDPRWAQPVVRFSIQLNSSYITMAMAPTTIRPANASPICMDEPALMSR